MKCFSKSYFRLLFALLFSCVFFILSSVNGYCSTTSSGATSSGVTSSWSDADKTAYLLFNIVDLVPAAYDFVVMGSGRESLTQEIFDCWTQRALEQEMSFDEWVNRNTTWYYLKDTSVQDENTLESIQLSPEAAQQIQVAINNYVAENPLGYTPVKIRSYNYLEPNNINNYQVYKSLQEFMKNSNGFCSIQGNISGGSFNNTGYILVIPKSAEYGFYGTSVAGVFSTAQLSINWQTSTQPWKISGSPCKVYQFNQSGQFTDVTSTVGIAYQSFANGTTLQYNTNQHMNVFTNLDKDESIYLFANLNAYKNYNAGLPQPYYMGSNFGSYNTTTYNVRDYHGMEYYYNQIVDNSKTGMTPEEVQKLIDEILDRIGNGGGSGGGSGSGSDTELDLGFLGKIGELIAKLINGIGNLITNVVGGIVDAVFNIIDLLTGEDGLFSRLSALIDGSFNSFLADIFSWLPPEVITVFTASIVIGLFFGIWKIVRG